MSNEILDIAARMKELREICEFTPEEMARELNVTPEAYASYESGAIDIPISVLLAMANAWEVRHGGFSGRTAQQFVHYLKSLPPQ